MPQAKECLSSSTSFQNSASVRWCGTKLSNSLVRILVLFFLYATSCIFDLASDFHRKDLEEAIKNGAFPKWTFSIQVVEEKDEHKFDFDILDDTKVWPEELVPLHPIGEIVLNATSTNIFRGSNRSPSVPVMLCQASDLAMTLCCTGATCPISTLK